MALIDYKKPDREKELKKYAKMKEDAELIGYNLRVPRRLFIKFKQKALLEDKHLRTVLLELIKQYVEK